MALALTVLLAALPLSGCLYAGKTYTGSVYVLVEPEEGEYQDGGFNWRSYYVYVAIADNLSDIDWREYRSPNGGWRELNADKARRISCLVKGEVAVYWPDGPLEGFLGGNWLPSIGAHELIWEIPDNYTQGNELMGYVRLKVGFKIEENGGSPPVKFNFTCSGSEPVSFVFQGGET